MFSLMFSYSNTRFQHDVLILIKLLGHCIGGNLIFIPGRGPAFSSAQQWRSGPGITMTP